MASKLPAISPNPPVRVPGSISICWEKPPGRSKSRRGRREGHKSLRRTPHNKGLSCSVRRGLALLAEDDGQRFRRLINLQAAGKRLQGFYSGSSQAPPPPTRWPNDPHLPLTFFASFASRRLDTFEARLGEKEEMTSRLFPRCV